MVGPQGQAKWAKVAKKSSTYDVTHKKPALPKKKNFFRVQTRRLTASSDALTRSQTGAETFPRRATCVQVFFFKNPRKQPYAKELGLWLIKKILTIDDCSMSAPPTLNILLRNRKNIFAKSIKNFRFRVEPLQRYPLLLGALPLRTAGATVLVELCNTITY